MVLGVRGPRDEFYAITVDIVNRLLVLDEDGEIWAGEAEAFGQKNEPTVAKMA